MKNILLLFIILLGSKFMGQSFTIQQNNMTLSGLSTSGDFSQGTYLDALANDSLTWSIVSDSLPSIWDFSLCFPNCYPIGSNSGNLIITNGDSYYLNCHIYPNNTTGEGYITMEITNSSGVTEQVTWHGVAGSVGIVNEFFKTSSEIKNIYNLNGQIVQEFQNNKIYIVQLKDNSVVKTFINN